ncbi:MAG: tetratricopeptide repeat protein [Planctomycetia bacterium]|nr:tetratricopeptide repeat protein [Planctomycetia bacterium]
MPDNLLDAKAIFNVARKIDCDEARAEYLQQISQGDAGLINRVTALLQGFKKQSRFLEAPSLEVGAATFIVPPEREGPGTVIGPYKLLEQIGEGGMGTVYVAEQKVPVRRTVALKVIKAGMDTREVIARFEAERQALAMMNHPNIAKVLDAGATEAGRPYFVMELVKGVPITDFCDQQKLATRERLLLFITLCQAVQHAHQKGLIHRDLKPSNLLVEMHDVTPVPKVIDFGVAKAMGQQLTEKTLHTGFSQMVGTPLYMSPEQAGQSSIDVDTRSDVYSLGVLLYEILTGHTPFESETLKSAGFDEMRRMIREVDPPRPSARISTLQAQALSTVSDRRQVEPHRLSQQLKGELDWIVMKALEKDRTRRYESATALAADVQRYLNDEPVEACPPSAAYRFRKFARRNKAPLMTAALVAAVAVTAGGFGWQHVRQQAATDRQVELALQEVTVFQGESNWAQATAALKRAEVLLAGQRASAALQHRTDGLRRDLDMASELEEIRLRATEFSTGDIFTGRGFEFKIADADYQKAFRAYGVDLETLDPPKAAEFLRAQAIHQELVAALDHWARLLVDNKAKRESRDRLLSIAGLADSDDWRNQVRLAIAEGNLDALKAFARGELVQTLPPSALDLLAEALRWLGANTEALTLLREAQRRHPGDFWINIDLAWMVRVYGSAHDESIRFCTAALATRPKSPDAYVNLAIALFHKGSLDDAEAMCRQAIRLKSEHASAHSMLARCLHAKGLNDEAATAFREVIRIDPTHFCARLNLGLVLGVKGSYDEAIAMNQETLRLFKDADTDGELWKLHANLGNALVHKRRLDEAIASYREAIRLNKDAASVHSSLGAALREKGQLDEAIASCREAIRLDKNSAPAHCILGDAYRANGQLDEAIASYREAIRLDNNCALAHGILGEILQAASQLDEAIASCREAIRLDKNCAPAHHILGDAYRANAQLDEAIASYREAVRLDKNNALAHGRLGEIFQATGQLDEAIASYREAIRLKPDDSWVHNNLGDLLWDKGQLGEAIASYREAAIRLKADNAERHNHLARLLANCADPKLRDIPQAVQLAQQAVKLDPSGHEWWNTLGVCQYRAGDWNAAVTALQKSMELDRGGNSVDWYVLAMAHWQLDHKKKARELYDQAVQWMEKNDPENEEFHRFRAEADELMKDK